MRFQWEVDYLTECRSFVQKERQMSRLERKKILYEQLNNIIAEYNWGEDGKEKIKCQVMKILNYLSNYTNVTNLAEIRKEHLINYMYHYIHNSFLEKSLKDLKNELKIFVLLLEKVNKEDLHINMSISNFNLWTKLFPPNKRKEHKDPFYPNED